MARFSSEYKRAFLLKLWEDNQGGETSLRDAIVAAIKGHVTTTEGGYLITATSQPGHSTSLFVPSAAGLTPLSLAELCMELKDRYDEASIRIGSSAESLIYDSMMSYLRPVRRYRSDFSNLRNG